LAPPAFQDTITISRQFRMKPADSAASPDNTPPTIDVPQFRPLERFWPYVDLPEQPTDEELARLDPALAEALFGTARRPFSASLEFPTFAGPDFERALALARDSAEYLEVGTAATGPRHRARFYPADARRLKTLFELVGDVPGCEVLIDDRPVPYARQLWLPMFWMLL
jgi:hypothetical protein